MKATFPVFPPEPGNFAVSRPQSPFVPENMKANQAVSNNFP
jgi:hypothetical protein